MTVVPVDVPGGRLIAEIRGEGPAVVLLNASSMDRRMWQGEQDWLAQVASVITYDPAGRGQSATIAGPVDARAHLAAVFDACSVDSAALIGLSDGGRLALEFAVTCPQRVVGVMTIGTVIPPERLEKSEEADAFAALLAALEPRSDAVARGDLAEAIRVDLEVWASAQPDGGRALAAIAADNAAFYRGADPEDVPLDPPIRRRLGQVRQPTTILVGGRDVPAARVTAAALASGIVGAKLVTVAAADHFANTSAPSQFRAAVSDFLESLAGAATAD